MDDNIIDGLRDAGCSEDLIELYGSAASDCARICLLKRHRREMLDDIHSGQQKLECLDYLIYRLRSKDASDKQFGPMNDEQHGAPEVKADNPPKTEELARHSQ